MFCSSEELSFYQSWVIIIAPIQSGCANITVLYAVPLICVLYYYALVLSVIGVFRRKNFTLFYWHKLVNWFYAKYSKRY